MENESYNKIQIAYQLQFFAKEGPGGEKTEDATAKKLQDARKDGQVAKSQELTMAVALLGLFLVLKIFVGYIATSFIEVFNSTYSTISKYAKDDFTTSVASAFFNEGLFAIIKISLPVFCVSILLAFLVNIYQVKWKVSAKPLQPKLEKINPIKGFKKMFTMDRVIDLFKSFAKIGAIIYLAYQTIQDQIDTIHIFYEITLEEAIYIIGDIVINLGLKISALFIFIGIVDYIYQKFKFKKDMKMSKQEVKDEYKQTEGDPQIKGKIRQKMREASQRRMMQKVPEADVVITNPTHFACALKYDKQTSDAPVLTAKGADYLAQKIKESARYHNIPIIENKPLARMLYTNVDLDQEIPQELYQMAAEVLAYVYDIQGKI